MKGHLVIAGGNIDSKIIYKEFINLAGENGKIALVPTAAGDTERALSNLVYGFEKLGIDRERIIEIKVDPDKGFIDGWRKSGDDFESLDLLKDVRGVWFSGGDQIKILRGFKRENGTDTRLLEGIRAILETGGVVGGSSAGAAIMSESMIGGGTSFGALTMPHHNNHIEYRQKPVLEESGALLLTRGLGFFNKGIIDQHFNERIRLGRLLEALFAEGVERGFGISEDTAVIYDMETELIRAVGSGGVTIMDISGAQRTKIGDYSRITDIKISYLQGEDIYNIRENKLYFKNKSETRDDKNYDHRNSIPGVIFSPHLSLEEITWHSLRDNKKELQGLNERNTVRMQDLQVGYEIRLFKKEESTRGDIRNNHSFENAVMEIVPVIIEAESLRKVAE